MKSSRIIIPLLAILALAGCKSQYELVREGNDVDAKYNLAFECFNAGKYAKAADLFENMSVLTNGTAREDTVLYYWGLSNYRNTDYITAETNFKNFLDKFPRSPFSESAEFLRVDCLYKATYRWELDQMPSRTCMSAINQYLREYNVDQPHREACEAMLHDLQDRIDRKDFEAGKQYYIMEDYPAARVKLRNVLKTNADNFYREDVLYYTAMASYHYARLSVKNKMKERYLTFVDDYLNFVGEYPESHYRKELDDIYNSVQEFIKQN
jgi:outer membrane protein assembly factor BamD